MTNFENELRRLCDEWRDARHDDIDSMMSALRAEIEFLKGIKAGRAAMSKGPAGERGQVGWMGGETDR